MIKCFCDKCGCETGHFNHISINPLGIGFPSAHIMKNIMAEPHENFFLCDKCTKELISMLNPIAYKSEEKGIEVKECEYYSHNGWCKTYMKPRTRCLDIKDCSIKAFEQIKAECESSNE